jgi:hypothetical protein
MAASLDACACADVLGEVVPNRGRFLRATGDRSDALVIGANRGVVSRLELNRPELDGFWAGAFDVDACRAARGTGR